MLLAYRYRVKSLTGSSKDLALHAGTLNAVCEQYAKSRRQRNRPFLRLRGRRSLGWVPFAERKIKDGTNFSCDVGRSSFRGMLRYKAIAHGAWYEEVNESFSTRVCSSCHAKTGPKSVAELGIGSWVCSGCGVSHDRDINSARNILFRSGHRTPAEGISALF